MSSALLALADVAPNKQLYACITAALVAGMYCLYTYAMAATIASEAKAGAVGGYPAPSAAQATTPPSHSPAPPKSPPAIRITIESPTPTKLCPWPHPPLCRPSLAGSHTVVNFPLSSWKPTPPSARKPVSTWEPDSDDEELDSDGDGSDSDDDSDTSSPPSPLFERLSSFPLPPQPFLYPEPVFIDLAALRKPVPALKGSQRIHKMVSARMHRRPARGTPADMLRRAVLEASGRRAEQAREEERWEASRRAFDEERSRGEVVLGAFDI